MDHATLEGSIHYVADSLRAQFPEDSVDWDSVAVHAIESLFDYEEFLSASLRA